MKGADAGQVIKMIKWLAPCLFLLAGGCTEKEDPASNATSPPDPHDDAIREFLKAPEQFKQVVATVRDEASFDRAAPGLAEVVQKFKGAAEGFKKLSPPDEANRPRYQKMIVDGFRGAEPTGEDMLSLLSIKSREKEVAAWMEAFMAATHEAVAEASRLYGKIGYAEPDGPPKIELRKPEITVPPFVKPNAAAPEDGGHGNPLLDHLRKVPELPQPDGEDR